MILLFAMTALLPLWAQSSSGENDSNSFSKAKSAYDIGNIAEARSILNNGMKTYSGQLKLEALHLLSLCCLAEDEPEAAEQYAHQLLKEDPFYRASLDDTPRFADLLQSLKSGTATVTSASQLAETLEEVPVPTTLITEEMIENSGCTNLQDLLCLYVPGMTKIEGDETNIAMHGVYGTFQEKILVMLNGHRLNSRTTNSETLDFRHSLSKIKQIEVLRGPASSLYGNVALTAVINIITKSGNEIDGAKITAGIGSFNTYKADFLMGKKYLDVDFTAWASIYSSKGQRLDLNPGDKYYYNNITDQPGYMYIGGYNGKPTYDIGVTANWRDFSFFLNTQYSKKVLSYTPLVSYGLYDYDKYGRIQGNTPGNSRQSTHLEIKYNKIWNNWSFSLNTFADFDNYSMYYVCGDKISYSRLQEFEEMGYYPTDVVSLEQIDSIGLFQCLQMEDFTYGINLQLGYSYKIKGHDGHLIWGVQTERYKMMDNQNIFGNNFNNVISYNQETQSEANNFRRSLLYGKETNVSGFLQVKQHISKDLIFNGGIRYDYKRQYNKTNLGSFSPRIALIWNPNEKINVKASYAHSFVDASYFYRANTSAVYKGGEKLTPEKMNACQITASYTFPRINLKNEINVYYNKLTDLVSLNIAPYGYMNIGKVNIFGIDDNLFYNDQYRNINLNISYVRVLNFSFYDYVKGNDMLNIPSFTGNLTFSNYLIHSNGLSLKILSNLLYKSYFNNYNRLTLSGYSRMNQTLILNLGLNCKWRDCSFSCYLNNLLDTDYCIGSQLALPYPQQGRNILFDISYSI